jgi:PKHD-type hydroxylase
MWNITPPPVPNEPYAWTRNVFSPAELKHIIDLGKRIPTEDGGVENRGVANYEARRSKVSWIKPSVETSFIFHKITDALLKVNQNFYGYDLTQIEHLQFSEYDSSYTGMYRNHTDDGFDSTYNRKLSFSLQLNDPSDYEGGDLQIYRFKLDNPTVVHKELGLFAAFPSFVIHEVTPVTVGTRYTLVGWAHGPRFR